MMLSDYTGYIIQYYVIIPWFFSTTKMSAFLNGSNSNCILYYLIISYNILFLKEERDAGSIYTLIIFPLILSLPFST